MPRTYPESLGMIAQIIYDNIDFEVRKIVLFEKLRSEIALTVQFHNGAYL